MSFGALSDIKILISFCINILENITLYYLLRGCFIPQDILLMFSELAWLIGILFRLKFISWYEPRLLISAWTGVALLRLWVTLEDVGHSCVESGFSKLFFCWKLSCPPPLALAFCAVTWIVRSCHGCMINKWVLNKCPNQKPLFFADWDSKGESGPSRW